jgi:Fe-S-cluster containining protein
MPLPPRHDELIQIVDAATADAARRSGPHLACRPGCHQCCIGAFAISALDAERLRHGLAELQQSDPVRAARVLDRAHAYIERTRLGFPGDPATGILDESDEAQEAFEEFANDEPCPALDAATGTCDLYAHRPLTCRAFGFSVHTGEGYGHCELCFTAATPEEIAAAALDDSYLELESELLSDLSDNSTIVAYALVAPAASRW